MSQPNHTSEGRIPPFLPGLILIGVFVLVVAILTPRTTEPMGASPSQRTPTAVTILPTATVFIEPALVPPTVESASDSPTATPGNVLTAIAVGAGPQAVTAAPTQPGVAATEALSVTSAPASDASPTPGNVLTAIAVGAGPQAVTAAPAQSDAAVSPTDVPPSSTPIPTEPAAPAPESSGTAAGDPAQGAMLYSSSCAACHGFDAHGIPGLGKDLINSAFVHSLTDAELLAFVIEGRDPSHPDNTTGILMPSRGGNAALTDQNILDIIAYIRSESS